MKKNKSITTGEIQQMANIIQSMNLSYLYEVEPSLILCPKIIGDSTDLLWIKEQTLFANRVLNREFQFNIELINEFKSLENEKDSINLLIAYKQLFPDTFEFYKKGFSQEILRGILATKLLTNTMCLINYRENVKTVLQVIQELILFKESMGLVNSFVPAYELINRVALTEEEIKAEINALILVKKIRFKRVADGILLYLNKN